jgi:hypothetical protein
LGLNYADGKLYYKNSNNAITSLVTSGGGASSQDILDLQVSLAMQIP